MRAVAIAAGGTGGHFFPAEALAAVLLRRGHRVVLFTDARSGALQSAVFQDAETHILSGAGLAGRGLVRGARAAAGLARGILQARAVLARSNFGAVTAFGGYPSVAPVLAARGVARRPIIVLHEQNAVLGRANRFLSRFADELALGFADTARIPPGMERTVTFNPVRPAIRAVSGRAYTPPGEAARLLILGGSLGARVFGDVVPAAVAALPEALRRRLHVTQQCRAEDLSRVQAAYAAIGVTAELAPFFTDIATRLAEAHVLIARAGASTCAEAASIGVPTLFVPLPGAIDDHQAANAAALAAGGGGAVLPQSGLTPAVLAAMLADWFDSPAELARRAACMALLGAPDAAETLADRVEHRMETAR